MAKEGPIVTEGTVTQVLPGTMFRVDLPGPRQCACAYLWKNAEAFHPHCSWRQSFSGAFAVRFDKSPHHFSRTI